MKKLLVILITFTVLSSCSEYQKALKSTDIGYKFTVGEQLYDDGKYTKANKVFAQIVPSYRGKPQAEKLMYLYCMSFYQMKDYHLSGYQMERFASSYPSSEKVEEISFLEAKSYYMLSPVYSKDQTETNEAIEKLQVFINNYPNSQYLPEANKMVRELDYKLEKKAYEIAKQYNHIEDYQASIKAFDNFIFQFPGSSLREDALYYKLDSEYNLAIRSVEWKKQERLEEAQSSCNTFKKTFGSSKYSESVEEMDSTISEELKKYI